MHQLVMLSAVFIISLYVSTSCNSFFVMDISQCNFFIGMKVNGIETTPRVMVLLKLKYLL
jgi:hypothetical protein